MSKKKKPAVGTVGSRQATRAARPARERKADVTCLVCGKKYRSIRADHLRDHGLTRERYRRVYGGTSVDDPLYVVGQPLSGSADQTQRDPHLALVERLSARVADSAGFLDALANECAEYILSAAPLRTQVAFAAAQVVQARVAIHAKAVGRLARVSNQLDEPWRVEAGGHQGAPTPTKDLLAIAMQAHNEVTKAEELVLKAARLALDEQKAREEVREIPGYAFTGAAESIAIPRDLSAPDREALRALMGNLSKHVDVQRQVRKATAAQLTADIETEEAAEDSALSEGVESASALSVGVADPIPMTATAPSSTTPPSRRRKREQT